MPSMYKRLSNAWKRPKQNVPSYRANIITWKREATITRADKPTRPDKARMLGYKAKTGFIIARVKITKGGKKRPRPHQGRKPSKSGQLGFTPNKSARLIAEERAHKKFINTEVLNSYWVGQSGQDKWIEVILVDTKRPEIINDKHINWILHTRGRAERGLTSAARRMRKMPKKKF